MIDSPPPAAKFARLAAILRKQIMSGQLEPGQPLPSELRLSQEHGVSRLTARAAVKVLRGEGLAIYQQGKGVFVKEREPLKDLVPEPGSTAICRPPTPEEQAELSLGEGVSLIWVVSPDGHSQIYPGDQWQLRWPTPGPTPR